MAKPNPRAFVVIVNASNPYPIYLGHKSRLPIGVSMIENATRYTWLGAKRVAKKYSEGTTCRVAAWAGEAK